MTSAQSAPNSALAAALPVLVCPQCSAGQGSAGQCSAGQESLEFVGDRTVGCPAGHRFDVAKQGYLPLLGGQSRTDTGDDAAMVAARAEFLAGNHFQPIADTVADLVGGAETVIDIGAGTGYYLVAVRPGRGVALDSSRYAARRAARAGGTIASVLADAWAPLPVRTGSVDAALVVFAPRDRQQIARVLRPGGSVVVVTPQPAHLQEIRGPLGMLQVDPGKADTVAHGWGAEFVAGRTVSVEYPMVLAHNDIRALVGMGPTARHQSSEQLARLVAELAESVAVTVSVSAVQLRRR